MLGGGLSFYCISKRYLANKILLLVCKRYLSESLTYLHYAQLQTKYNCNSNSTPEEKILTLRGTCNNNKSNQSNIKVFSFNL